MSLPEQLALTAARLLQRSARDYAGHALQLMRREAKRTAERLEAAGPPLAALTEAGLRLSELSCRCVDQLVRQGLASAQGALTDGAERLRITARAESPSALYAEQRAMLPASGARIAKELQATWKIVASTGRALVEIAESTRKELVRGSRTKQAATPRRRRPRGSGPATRRRAQARPA